MRELLEDRYKEASMRWQASPRAQEPTSMCAWRANLHAPTSKVPQQVLDRESPQPIISTARKSSSPCAW